MQPTHPYISNPYTFSQPSHIHVQAPHSHAANPAIYRHPNLILPTNPYPGIPISFGLPSHIQATQTHAANPSIYRHPNLIQPAQPHTGNPATYRQPNLHTDNSTIQTIQAGNPVSHNTAIYRQLGFILAPYG